ncbi:MAG: AEC family transporter [Clostridia bacterium]|nr:AEC family transporter [Clostridia bacterium]
MEIFSLTINQITLMFTFMLVGYILRKCGTFPESASKVFSKLLVNVCLTGMVFSTCYNKVTVEKMANNGKAVLAGTVMIFMAYFLSMVLAKIFTKDKFERNVYKYAYTAPNFGYMGYPLVQAVFGDEVLMLFMMFALPLNVFIYTKGMALLCPQKKYGIVNVFKQPTIIALVVGSALGLSGLKLPAIVDRIATTASDCMAPIAMIIAGCVMAEKPLKTLLSDWKVYISSLIKLVVMPLLAMGVLVLLKVDPAITLVAATLWAMPFGMNTVVFPEAYGGDGRKGAQLSFISHVMSIITIPIVFSIISNIVK